MNPLEVVNGVDFAQASEISVQPLEPQVSAVQTLWQMTYDSRMEKLKDTHQGGQLYNKTVALLLSWSNSDLTTAGEVAELRNLLQENFKFHVVEQLLDKDIGPQKQLNKCLADFVAEYDSKDTLLIIYYAGHGWSEKNEDNEKEFYLIERVTQKAWGHKHNKVTWLSSEQILDGAEGGVLGIFDCCHAGHLCQFRSPPRFEYLGACASEQTTPPPGPNSFTSALIWSLKQLRPSGAFSTSALQRKIKYAPNFPKAQYPHLGHRLAGGKDHIMIAARRDDKVVCQPPIDQQHIPNNVCDFLEFRMHVSEISEEVIEAWATAMHALGSNPELKVERINFRGTNVSRAALLWLSRFRSNTEGRVSPSIATEQQSTDPMEVTAAQDPHTSAEEELHRSFPSDNDPLTPNSLAGGEAQTNIAHDDKIAYNGTLKRKSDDELESRGRKHSRSMMQRSN